MVKPPMNTTFAKVLLQGVANKIGVKFYVIDEDKDSNTIVCYWVSHHFKNSSNELRHYWIDKSIADYASKVHEYIHVIYDAYTEEELAEITGSKLALEESA